MSNNNPKNMCYIIILGDDDDTSQKPYRVEFQIMPDKITDTKSATFSDGNIIGRSSPLKTYQYSSARKVALTLEFFASIEADDLANRPETYGLTEVKRKVSLLRGLVNPNYGAKLIARPRKCIVRLGESMGMIGFCTNVAVTLRGDYPWALSPALAHYASVALSFEDTGESTYSFDDIILNKDFASWAAEVTSEEANSGLLRSLPSSRSTAALV